MPKLKTLLLNGLVLAAASVAGVLLCEAGLRLFLNPADFLSVEMVKDPILGAVPAHAVGSGGFDAWGFRNKKVPETAEIVAIGDSHTFGNTATLEDAWPAVVERQTGRTVYDAALGGYGPNQYLHILKTRALSLHPKAVVAGLYMGDDFENAFLMTYGFEHWAYLRQLPPEKVNFDIWQAPPAPTPIKKLRVWLSRHSLTYQLLFHGPLLGAAQGMYQVRNAHDLNPEATSLLLPDRGIEEAFLPQQILRRLNQQNASVREGMRITFHLLAEMNRLCKDHGSEFAVVIIPTKETVFASLIEGREEMPHYRVIMDLVRNEEAARNETAAFLESNGIPFVDSLPALKSAVGGHLYARTATDMHPGKNGYRVIGEAVARFLKERWPAP